MCSRCQSGIAQMLIRNADRRKRDVLFVVSNAHRMAAKQRALAERLGRLRSEWRIHRRNRLEGMRTLALPAHDDVLASVSVAVAV